MDAVSFANFAPDPLASTSARADRTTGQTVLADRSLFAALASTQPVTVSSCVRCPARDAEHFKFVADINAF